MDGMNHFNADKIVGHLSDKARNLLSKIEIFPVLDSTNTYLLAQAKSQGQSGWVCLAGEQTQGRGRRGKTWVSPTGGNIYCSFMWQFPDAAQLSGLSLAVSVLIAEALEVYGIKGIQLKWPNDVMFAGRKLGGILVESIMTQEQITVIAGFGLNCNLPDESKAVDWIDLDEILGGVFSREVLIATLLNHLLPAMPVFREQGLAAFLPRFQTRNFLYKQSVTIETPQKKITGIVQGVTEEGKLILSDQDGIVYTFLCGEVSVRRSAIKSPVCSINVSCISDFLLHLPIH